MASRVGNSFPKKWYSVTQTNLKLSYTYIIVKRKTLESETLHNNKQKYHNRSTALEELALRVPTLVLSFHSSKNIYLVSPFSNSAMTNYGQQINHR